MKYKAVLNQRFLNVTGRLKCYRSDFVVYSKSKEDTFLRGTSLLCVAWQAIIPSQQVSSFSLFTLIQA